MEVGQQRVTAWIVDKVGFVVVEAGAAGDTWITLGIYH